MVVVVRFVGVLGTEFHETLKLLRIKSLIVSTITRHAIGLLECLA